MRPKGWEAITLRDVINIKHGFAFDSSGFNTEGRGYRLLTGSNFREEGGFFDVGEKQKYYDGPIDDEYLLREGDLLVVMTEQAPGLLGSPVLVPADRAYLHNQRLGLVQFKVQGRIDKRYLYHCFNLHEVRKAVSTTAAGTKVRHSSPDRIMDIEHHFPPYREQQRIAYLLDQVDLLTRTLERQRKAHGARRRGLLQQLVTGRRRLSGFTGRWRRVTIGDVLREVDRRVEMEDGTPYRLASVHRNWEGLFDRGCLYGRDIKTKNLREIRAGDFLISHIQAAYGSLALVPLEFDRYNVSDLYTCLVSADPRAFDTRFFAYLAQQPRMTYVCRTSSNGFFAERLRLGFMPEVFLQQPILVPPTLEEQVRIIQVLENADRALVLLDRTLAAHRERKRGLMQQLMTGRFQAQSSAA